MTNLLHGRRILAGIATGIFMIAVVLTAQPRANDDTKKSETVAFFLIGDTHLLANKKDEGKLDERSAVLSAQLVNVMNKLADTEIPKAAGGGKVLTPRGVIHAGDCIDTGDQAKVKMQQTEWSAFTKVFGLTGKDGQLKMPIYEVHGNHDSVRGENLVIKSIIERNKTRPDVSNVSKNGVHYSWDWGHVHFVNLGIVVGQGDGATKRRRYDPLGSLDFLIADLKDKVGTSGRPIVITHHIDMLRHSAEPADEKKAVNMEWDPNDVKGFYAAIKDYNVAAILYGHTHGRNVYHWNGTNKASKTGVPVFNVTKSSHFAGKVQGLFYLEIQGDTVLAREYQTKDGWETGTWTPQTWTAKASAAK